jgi:hypothetical protein
VLKYPISNIHGGKGFVVYPDSWFQVGRIMTEEVDFSIGSICIAKPEGDLLLHFIDAGFFAPRNPGHKPSLKRQSKVYGTTFDQLSLSWRIARFRAISFILNYLNK